MKDKVKPRMPALADRMGSKKQLDSFKKAKTTPDVGKVMGSANRSEGPGYKRGAMDGPVLPTKAAPAASAAMASRGAADATGLPRAAAMSGGTFKKGGKASAKGKMNPFMAMLAKKKGGKADAKGKMNPFTAMLAKKKKK